MRALLVALLLLGCDSEGGSTATDADLDAARSDAEADAGTRISRADSARELTSDSSLDRPQLEPPDFAMADAALDAAADPVAPTLERAELWVNLEEGTLGVRVLGLDPNHDVEKIGFDLFDGDGERIELTPLPEPIELSYSHARQSAGRFDAWWSNRFHQPEEVATAAIFVRDAAVFTRACSSKLI